MRPRLTAAAVALLALVGGAAVAPVSAAPVAVQGTLGAETTLTWTGVTAIRLGVPKTTEYRDGDVDLLVTGATYAFVRLMAPYRPGCPDRYGPRCDTDRVSWVAGVHDGPRFARHRPSRRHDALMSIPAQIRAPYLDVFLLTDGRATLTIRTTSLKGRTAYRPSRRLHGRAGPLPSACVPLGCATATGRSNAVTYGGATFDLRGPGWAEVWAEHGDDTATGGERGNQFRTLATCLYPNSGDRRASPEPADHAYGCDDTSGDEGAVSTAFAALAHASTAAPSAAQGTNVPWSGAHGRQYIGFQAIGAGPAPSRVRAFGIWFRFLD